MQTKSLGKQKLLKSKLSRVKMQIIYRGVHDWIQRMYTNPSEVITGKIENEMFKGNGLISNAIHFDYTSSNLKYFFIFDIRDNQISITYRDFEVSTGSGYYSAETYLYKKNGSLKTNSKAISVKEGIEKEIGALINSLLISLNLD